MGCQFFRIIESVCASASTFAAAVALVFTAGLLCGTIPGERCYINRTSKTTSHIATAALYCLQHE